MGKGFMFKKIVFVIFCIMLNACSQQMASNIVQKSDNTLSKVNDVDNYNKKRLQQTAIRYLCKDNKDIKITKIIKNEKTKLKSISLTFNGRTQKLIQNISEVGKTYTNINWHWYERSNYSVLSTSVGDILAENCVRQE